MSAADDPKQLPTTSSTEDLVLAPQKSRRTRSAAADSAETIVEEIECHALPAPWEFHALVATAPTGKGSKKSNAKNVLISEINTVEGLWSIFSTLLVPSKITTKTNLIFTRKGVTPEWEDPANADGGEWLAEFPPSSSNRDKVDSAWENTVAGLLSGDLCDPDDVSCVWFQVRAIKGDPQPAFKILIWTRSSGEKAEAMGKKWVQMLADRAGIAALPCTFVSHKDAIANYKEATETKNYSKEPRKLYSLNQ